MGLFSRTKSEAPAAAPAAPAASDLSALTGDYTIDPTHSSIGFTVRHAMVTTVRGEFGEYEGKLHLDGSDPSRSTAELTIKVASIDTNQQQRDEHLRTGDFFEAEAYPEITFRSTSAQRVDDETYRMTGDLTIKATTRPVTLDLVFNGSATDPYGNLRVGFEGGTTVNRSEWGLTYNAALEGGGVLISDKAKLVLDISAIKAA
ncbi:YceI family protein [Streptacidiphilus sp. ASG 303]|uniref:YceI family protein n=1 Tax=Streptacidiphilus sp. ASG 303 TaxID=2896847 RepID=UPI001E38D9A5|nr:YceI family protein [Streptacidiphilus sp. ASG 303]MCD0481469.1 YceI family protein [Streptacidiphilus sp. ASG 303]